MEDYIKFNHASQTKVLISLTRYIFHFPLNSQVAHIIIIMCTNVCVLPSGAVWETDRTNLRMALKAQTFIFWTDTSKHNIQLQPHKRKVGQNCWITYWREEHWPRNASCSMPLKRFISVDVDVKLFVVGELLHAELQPLIVYTQGQDGT